MPWKASSVMEERLRFVARLLDGEAMTDVCRDFGGSRKTGYKIFDRYKEQGLTALTDRSRRPVRYSNQLPEQIEGLIVRLKAEKPHWGARKIRELLVRRLDGMSGFPLKAPSMQFSIVTAWSSAAGHATTRAARRCPTVPRLHPQQNGRHERMHLTLKKEASGPPDSNSLQRQERFDAFLREFNAERPHQALDMKFPAELYTASARSYDGLPELTYPFHDRDVMVTACGRLCLHRKRINISTVLAGQKLGIKEVDYGI
jgi:transposase